MAIAPIPKRPHAAETKTGTTGIFVEENLKMAEHCQYHIGRFVKIQLKSGLKMERQINIPFIKAVQLGVFKVLTDLR